MVDFILQVVKGCWTHYGSINRAPRGQCPQCTEPQPSEKNQQIFAQIWGKSVGYGAWRRKQWARARGWGMLLTAAGLALTLTTFLTPCCPDAAIFTPKCHSSLWTRNLLVSNSWSVKTILSARFLLLPWARAYLLSNSQHCATYPGYLHTRSNLKMIIAPTRLQDPWRQWQYLFDLPQHYLGAVLTYGTHPGSL